MYWISNYIYYKNLMFFEFHFQNKKSIHDHYVLQINTLYEYMVF